MMLPDLGAYPAQILWGINAIGAVAIIHFERGRPRSAILWLLLMLLIPFFGILVYIFFGHSIHWVRPSLKRKEEGDMLRMDPISRGRKIADPQAVLPCLGISEYRGLAEMIQSTGSNLTEGNNITQFNWGKEKFDSLFKDIQEAKDHVHVQYYIIRNDKLAGRFVDLLISKAREGVKVRFLIDDLGNKLPAKTVKRMRDAGVEVDTFFPSLLKHIPFLNLHVNHRNHRKIVIIDGRIGYVGGYNIGDEYLGEGKLGQWRDTHLRVEGQAVLDLQSRFLLDWDFASPRKLDVLPRYFPDLPAMGEVPLQIISDGPDKRLDLIQEAYLKMIGTAQSKIYLQTPYFIPDQSILDALKVAALSGVDVRVMIPMKPDHPLVHWANLSFLSELLKCGVKGYLFEQGFLHAKTIVVDGSVASIGSANWDIRSLELNFETNAMIYCPRAAQKQEDAFLEDIGRSQEWSYEASLLMPLGQKLKCGFSRVFSPLL
ncbi:cardiolipin synthase [Methanomassiliicoccus luminyensis]|uniref:cardiolipin synthase n=1 Tax=Methanomassiliicoccus luminyensis TaxID=1080712 RepID=UPI00037E47F3|nr:cardiolipin synthase [Methanomassiliicoccus luminyensis]